MYIVRLFAIEAIFFSYYQSYDANFKLHDIIPPVVQNDLLRIPFYVFPALVSILVNGIRLAKTFEGSWNLFLNYPQVFFLPGFTPFMYEGVQYVNTNGQKSTRIRIWKRGTLMNAYYLFCFAPIGLAISEYARGTFKWDFTTNDTLKYKYTNVVFKTQSGNIAFCIVALILSLTLIPFLYSRFFEDLDSEKMDVSLNMNSFSFNN
jgi:hypothetical protein